MAVRASSCGCLTLVDMKIILQKFIADSGYCSRRKAEELIRLGRVKVDGKRAELGMYAELQLIASRQSEVKVDGKKIELHENKIYIKLNKPVDYACTSAKVKGEKNVFNIVETRSNASQARLHIVGRLDKNSRGLVLLTNDGELTQRITHPKFEHEKKYLVKVKNQESRIKPALSLREHEVKSIIKKFKSGINIDDGDGEVRAKEIKHLKNNSFEIILTYGKKRQIRRMFKQLGFEVVDLFRIEIAGLKLGNLQSGEWEYLAESEIKKLKNLK